MYYVLFVLNSTMYEPWVACCFSPCVGIMRIMYYVLFVLNSTMYEPWVT